MTRSFSQSQATKRTQALANTEDKKQPWIPLICCATWSQCTCQHKKHLLWYKHRHMH